MDCQLLQLIAHFGDVLDRRCRPVDRGGVDIEVEEEFGLSDPSAAVLSLTDHDPELARETNRWR